MTPCKRFNNYLLHVSTLFCPDIKHIISITTDVEWCAWFESSRSGVVRSEMFPIIFRWTFKFNLVWSKRRKSKFNLWSVCEILWTCLNHLSFCIISTWSYLGIRVVTFTFVNLQVYCRLFLFFVCSYNMLSTNNVLTIFSTFLFNNNVCQQYFEVQIRDINSF